MEARSRAFRPAVLAKHNRTCQATWLCRKKGPLSDKECHADHIIPRWKDGPDTVDNGQVLCIKHHKEKSAREAAERANKKTSFAKVMIVAFHLYAAFLIIIGLVQYMRGESLTDVTSAAIWGVLVASLLIVSRRKLRLRPRAKKTAQVKKGAIDFDRLVSTARGVMGNKGEIIAYPGHNCDAIVSYEGTEFPDGNHERRMEFTDRLRDKLGGRWLADWQTNEDEVWLTRAPEITEYIEHPGFDKSVKWNVIQIAADAFFDLKKTSHLLICGLTNSGKTGLLHCIIAHLSWCVRLGQIECLILLDPKRVELTGWRGQPGVADVYTEPQTMWDGVDKFDAELTRRLALHELWERSGKTEGAPLSSHQPWIMLIDEYEEFLEIMQGHANELVNGKMRESTTLKRPPTPVRQVGRAARLARKAKMHLILATQRGDAELIGGRVRNNFGGRVLVGRGGAAESLMCFGISTYGRDVPAIQGRMTVQTGEARPREVQGYYVPDPGAEEHSATERAILARLGLTAS